MSDKQDLCSLIRALASDTTRYEAADTLISLGTKAVEPLRAALKVDNWKIRGNAAWTLGKIGDANAVDALIETLNDKVPEVRATAGRALINIGQPSVEPLMRFIDNDDTYGRSLAACVLSCLEDNACEQLMSESNIT